MNRKISAKELLSYIYNVIRPFSVPLFVMVFVAIVTSVELSLRPYLLKVIIDRISDPSVTDVFAAVSVPAILYFLLTFFKATLYRIYEYFVDIKMIPNLRRNIANMCFESLLKQSYSYYQNNFAGSLSNKVNDLTYSIPEIVKIVVDRFFSHGLALIVAIFTLWQVNSIFAIGMLCWTAFFIGGSFYASNKLSSLADAWSEWGSTITGRMVDSLSSILSVRLFAREKQERALLASTFDSAVKAEQKLNWAYFWVWFFYGYSFVLVLGVSLYALLVGRQEGWITVGDFVVVLGINFAIVDFLWEITKDFSLFSALWGKATQALRSIKVKPEIEDIKDAKDLQVTEGRIEFENMRFHYKGTEPLFQNKCVTIEPGQKVGLVGYSGSGKSTFVNLILRLYDVTDGRILIDGQNVKEVTQDSLHAAIGMIPQDPSLFNRSLMDNIRYGKMDATDEEVMIASRRGHAHDFISKIPEMYEAQVGERGVKLSGGQRQRIAIARAILKNAPILILDEATSQLDSITENHIQESLWELMQGKTTLIVAHRLSTLLNMDRILVFDRGRIVGDGTHQELVTQGGLYKTLWDAQVGGFLPDQKGD